MLIPYMLFVEQSNSSNLLVQFIYYNPCFNISLLFEYQHQVPQVKIYFKTALNLACAGEENTDKSETPSTTQKAKFVYLVLFVKKGPCYIVSLGKKSRNHIFLVKKKRSIA